MAKVGSKEFKIGTAYNMAYPLYYTQSKKFEIRGIVDEFFKLTGISNSGYQTEQDLTKAIFDAIPIYHKLKEKQRLVIGYRCRATPALTMIEKSLGHYQGRRSGISRRIMSFDGFGTPYCTVGFDYCVYMEIYNGTVNEYFSVGDDLKVNSTTAQVNSVLGMTFINYTEDNFKFFEDLKRGMQEMVVKMSVFFDMDSDTAELCISNNVKLIG